MCKAICIDDTNIPKEIPINKRIKSGQTYEIIYTTLCKPQDLVAVSLAEIEMDDNCLPYEYWLISRFAFTEENLKLLQELIKNCNETDFSIEQLLEQTTLEEV